MKTILLLTTLTLSFSIWAAELKPSITCTQEQKTNSFAVKAQGEPIIVGAIEAGGAAYVWVSKEGLDFTFVLGEKLGSSNQKNFIIHPSKQKEPKKRYTFRLVQSFIPIKDQLEGPALKICTVVVKK